MYAARGPEVSAVPERATTALAAPAAETRLAAIRAPAPPLEPPAHALEPVPARAAAAAERPAAATQARSTSAARRSSTQRRASESTSPKGRSAAPRGRAVDAPPCDPPYSIDVHGIKRFRRECLAGKP